jgi:hypothetical protein
MKKNKKHYIQTAIVSVFFVAAFAFLVSGNTLTNNFDAESQQASAGDFDWKAFYSVEKLVLIDADTNKEVRELVDGDIVARDEFVKGRFSIEAVTTPSVNSVRFDVDDKKEYRKDSLMPFASAYELYGNFHQLPLELGKHTITATPFSHRRARGFIGDPISIEWTLVDQSEPI